MEGVLRLGVAGVGVAFSVPSHLPVNDTFLELLVPWCIFFKK